MLSVAAVFPQRIHSTIARLSGLCLNLFCLSLLLFFFFLFPFFLPSCAITSHHTVFLLSFAALLQIPAAFSVLPPLFIVNSAEYKTYSLI